MLGVSRKDDHDDWGLPGGKVEREETYLQGAVRECLEETGILVVESKLHEVFRGPARTPGRMMVVFRAEDWCKQSEPREGEGRVAWIHWTDLERGSFGDFHKVFHQAFDAQQKLVLSFKPLLKRIVQSPMGQTDVEDAVAERFGIAIPDAIRLVCSALSDGTLRRDPKIPALVFSP